MAYWKQQIKAQVQVVPQVTMNVNMGLSQVIQVNQQTTNMMNKMMKKLKALIQKMLTSFPNFQQGGNTQPGGFYQKEAVYLCALTAAKGDTQVENAGKLEEVVKDFNQIFQQWNANIVVEWDTIKADDNGMIMLEIIRQGHIRH